MKRICARAFPISQDFAVFKVIGDGGRTFPSASSAPSKNNTTPTNRG